VTNVTNVKNVKIVKNDIYILCLKDKQISYINKYTVPMSAPVSYSYEEIVEQVHAVTLDKNQIAWKSVIKCVPPQRREDEGWEMYVLQAMACGYMHKTCGFELIKEMDETKHIAFDVSASDFLRCLTCDEEEYKSLFGSLIKTADTVVVCRFQDVYAFGDIFIKSQYLPSFLTDPQMLSVVDPDVFDDDTVVVYIDPITKDNKVCNPFFYLNAIFKCGKKHLLFVLPEIQTSHETEMLTFICNHCSKADGYKMKVLQCSRLQNWFILSCAPRIISGYSLYCHTAAVVSNLRNIKREDEKGNMSSGSRFVVWPHIVDDTIVDGRCVDVSSWENLEVDLMDATQFDFSMMYTNKVDDMSQFIIDKLNEEMIVPYIYIINDTKNTPEKQGKIRDTMSYIMHTFPQATPIAVWQPTVCNEDSNCFGQADWNNPEVISSVHMVQNHMTALQHFYLSVSFHLDQIKKGQQKQAEHQEDQVDQAEHVEQVDEKNQTGHENKEAEVKREPCYFAIVLEQDVHIPSLRYMLDACVIACKSMQKGNTQFCVGDIRKEHQRTFMYNMKGVEQICRQVDVWKGSNACPHTWKEICVSDAFNMQIISTAQAEQE